MREPSSFPVGRRRPPPLPSNARIYPATAASAARRALGAALLAALVLPPPATAQEAPYRGLPVEGGVTEAGLLLRQLDGVKRVLVVAAHPDDEDNSLLAELSRHEGARAAYLSLTRGEGGQNVIGPELGEGLGLLRTEELLSARRIEGTKQYFTRAYDFGFSKTAAESFSHWPRDTLLSDMVWVIRTFRPQVVVSIFSGTPADGHGQHQVAGILAREAFDAAGDSARFPEQLRWGARPWQPAKLYQVPRTAADSARPTLRIQTGEYDPLLGMSPFQLAMLARSSHRSQGFGELRPPGPRARRLVLLRSRVASDPGRGLFAGVDTSLAGLVRGLPGKGPDRAELALRSYRAALRAARDSLRVLNPAAAVPPLAEAVRSIAAADRLVPAGRDARSGFAHAAIARRHRLAARALLAVSGVTARFRAGRDLWVPGQTVRIEAELWNGGQRPLEAGPPELNVPDGWSVRLLPADSVRPSQSERDRYYDAHAALAGGAAPRRLPPGSLARWTFELRVPPDAPPTEQYFLRRDTVGDLYRWPEDSALRARPLDPPLVTARLPVEVSTVDPGSGEGSGSPGEAAGGRVRVVMEGAVRYRGLDPAQGEFWRPVYVVPRVSVAAGPQVVVWPTTGPTATRPRKVDVTARSQVDDTLPVGLSLSLPAGWTSRPDTAEVSLEGRGATETRRFELRVPAGGGAPDDTGAFRSYRVGAAAADRRSWRRGFTLIDYPHVDPVPLFSDARVRVERFPVAVATGRAIGYVMGSGDEVPAAIRQLGLDVQMLGPDRLRSGDLSGLDVIVIGVRAYEVRGDLQASNQRLLDWARAGGTLIVQYDKYPFVDGGYPPYPATMAHPHDRVTDEHAAVTLLHPEAPPLASPNRIGPRDFEGWIQERGLYFFHSWDSHYTPLLSMADPGESPKEGSLLVAALGKGVYVYTGLDFFRELPAGVPGAYRLFANLLSLTPEAWRGWLAGRAGHADEPGGSDGQRTGG